MMILVRITILLATCLVVYVLLTLIRLIKKVWLNPIRVQYLMSLQGIKGPPPRFIWLIRQSMSSLISIALIAAEGVGALISGGISGAAAWGISKLVTMGMWDLAARVISKLIGNRPRSITNGRG